MADVIASKSGIVHDDALGIDRQLIAGQPVPPDLVDAAVSEGLADKPKAASADELAGQQRASALGLGTATGVAPSGNATDDADAAVDAASKAQRSGSRSKS